MFLRKSFVGFNAFFSVLRVILRSKASCVNYLLVVLVVVSLVNGDSTECDRHLTDSSGDITSPNYPDKYPVSTSCSWKIVAPPYDKIQLTFIVFKVKAGSSQSVCDKDFVEIIDGTRILGKYCNSHEPPRTIHSDSNLLTVIFKSNSLARNPKEYFMFYASYEREPCGEYLTGLKGEISSPNNPGPYPVPKHCSWKIQVPPDMVIVLYFLVFALEPTSYCNLDYIRAIDGFNTTSRLIGHFCAKRKPRNQIRSTNNQMVLDFHAFTPTESAGFHAFYEAHPHCGGILRGSTGTFTSPSVLTKCTWKIEVSEGEIISIVFDISSTINNNHCGDDFVEVFDGKDESLSLGRYCSKPANSVRSSGNRMIVKLHHSIHQKGLSFSASYTAVDPKNMYYQCSETSDELLYKCDNGNYIQCQWKCDDTDDCGDRSDEKNCGKKKTTPSSDRSKLRNYVIILVSITGSAVVIFLVVFFVDRLRKKRRSQATRRRRRRRARRALDADLGEPSSPPPPYDFAVSTSSCCEVTGNPPTYAQAVSPVIDSESQEIGTADVEYSDQVTVNDGLSDQITFNAGEDTTQISQDNSDSIILGESPPSSVTSPLIV